jgi:hypothetical protein
MQMTSKRSKKRSASMVRTRPGPGEFLETFSRPIANSRRMVYFFPCFRAAGMVELADTQDLKSQTEVSPDPASLPFV